MQRIGFSKHIIIAWIIILVEDVNGGKGGNNIIDAINTCNGQHLSQGKPFFIHQLMKFKYYWFGLELVFFEVLF